HQRAGADRGCPRGDCRLGVGARATDRAPPRRTLAAHRSPRRAGRCELCAHALVAQPARAARRPGAAATRARQPDRRGEAMKRAAVLFAPALLWVAGAAGAEVAPQPVRVSAQVAGASQSVGGQLVPAAVVAGQRATISTRVSATVSAVAVEEGARVRKGQLLVMLNAADF